MKKYMEASLGATVDNTGRKVWTTPLPCTHQSHLALGQDFLTYGKRVLRLYCEWTDSTMFGDKNFYILHYFMADGSIEILERPQPNSVGDSNPGQRAPQRAVHTPPCCGCQRSRLFAARTWPRCNAALQ